MMIQNISFSLFDPRVSCFMFVLFIQGADSFVSDEYLNQPPPGETAEIFAPGIVNTGLWTRDIAIMPDGTEIYFGAGIGDDKHASIMVTRLEAGKWTTPREGSVLAGYTVVQQ